MPDDEIDDRLSRRFDDTADSEASTSQTEETNMTSQTDSASQTSQSNRKSQTSQTVQNIKKEWNVRSFYLDDELSDELLTAYKRLDFHLSDAGEDIDLQKTRHFYPLIVELGLERLEEMDITEITERLESTDSISR